MNTSQFLINPPPTVASDFPSDVLKLMKKNVKPKILYKLIQICKYFYYKEFPYYVIKDVYSNYSSPIFSYQTHDNVWTKEEPLKRLWITDALYIRDVNNIASSVIAKIAFCGVYYLCIGSQRITFDELKFLTDSRRIQQFHFTKSTIHYDNGEAVPLEAIFKCVPNAWEIVIEVIIPPLISLESANKNVSKKLTKLQLLGINKNFCFHTFSKFMDCNPQIRFVLKFTFRMTDDQEETLQAYVNKIIEKGLTENPLPWITFFTMTKKSYDALEKMKREDDFRRDDDDSD